MTRDSLQTRLVILTTFIALLVAVLAGLFAYPLIQSAAQGQAKARLAGLADITASSLERGMQAGRQQPLPRRLAQSLSSEDITGFLVFDPLGPPPGTSARQVAALLDGNDVSADGEVDGRAVFVEGRALVDGTGMVLIQPQTAIGGFVGDVLSRFAIALVVGLIIAAVIGAFAARRLAAPLRAAREAANRITAGDRDVTVDLTGPNEIDEISEALNQLSTTLAVSENRQREFLMSVSHELRTPLTAIKGYGEAMSDGVIEVEDVERVGATVAAEARRLERLVNDLLDLARAGAVDFKVDFVETDVNELLEDVYAVWADRCARDDVQFTLNNDGRLPMVQSDPVRLRQIIDNLMENALRISPADTFITCTAHVAESGVVIRVRDSGPGLTTADLSDAFEPGVLFDRYRGVRPVGTGLGLALVGRLAAGLGAHVWAEQELSGGAAFSIRLPLQPRTV